MCKQCVSCRSLGLNPSWEMPPCGPSCWVLLCCRLFCNVSCCHSALRAPGTSLSTAMRRAKPAAVSLTHLNTHIYDTDTHISQKNISQHNFGRSTSNHDFHCAKIPNLHMFQVLWNELAPMAAIKVGNTSSFHHITHFLSHVTCIHPFQADIEVTSNIVFQSWWSCGALMKWMRTCRRWERRASRWWGRRRWPSLSCSAPPTTVSLSLLPSCCNSHSSCLELML